MGEQPLRAAPAGGGAIAAAARAAEWIGGRLVAGPPDRPFFGVATDHRWAEPGDLFVALVGERVDGHRFVADAAARGAAGALVAPDFPAGDAAAGLPAEFFLLAADPEPGGSAVNALPADASPESRARRLTTTVALGRLAAGHRRALRRLRVVAITGSVGKTSVKDLLAGVLARRFRVVATQGNWNTEVGVPLTLLRAGPSTEVVVLEAAMRGPGQIAWLADLSGPDVGCVTNVGLSHAGLLGSLEAVAQAKGELVERLAAGKTACLNADDPECRAMAARTRARVLWFGEGPAAQVRAEDVRMEGALARFTLLAEDSGGRAPVALRAPGRHQVANALAAAACAVALGLGPADVAPGLEAPLATGMRLEIARFGPVLVVNDAYNASPASMRAALDVLAAVAGGRRRVAVLGDMLELGPFEREAHREVGRAAAAAGVQRLVAVGPRSRELAAAARDALDDAAVHWTDDPARAPQLALSVVEPGDAVLVKASRGLRLEAVVEALRERWGREEASP